jgi:7-cyano-7-deazaguanine synthase in queuosine biosynthesis
MKLTYGGQTIDFYEFTHNNVIVLSVSGGLDSASAAYLTCKHFPEIEIVPICCRDLSAPGDADRAENIVKWLQKEFPNNKIRDIKITDFDDRTESIVSYAECDEAINHPSFNYGNLNRVQMSKIIQVDRIMRKAMDENPRSVRLDGMTRNPPTAIMKELGFYEKAERRRDHEVPRIQEARTVYAHCEATDQEPFPLTEPDWLNNIYQAYINVDKKFVAGVYQENNLMETLFPLTGSCVGTARETDNFKHECGKCFWCYEKSWAFDLPLPNAMLTKGGPGDRSTPGNVNTGAWWKNLNDEGKEVAAKEGSIVQQAKDKDIYFCTIPFTQIYSELDGQYQACCFGEPSGVSVEEVPLKEWMEKSDYMNDLRRDMTTPGSDLKAVNKWCQRCRGDEDRYGRSRRTNCMKIHTNDPTFWNKIERQADKFRETGEFTLKGAGRIFEVQLKIYGSECNLDCFMCMHNNSTTRMQVAKNGVWNDNIFGKQSPSRDAKNAQVMKDKTAGVTEQIIEMAQYIKSIKIIGGEPLIMKKHYEMLDALIETGHADKIRIKYQTNLTKTKAGKHNIFKYIPHFERVTIVASVDGIGPVIEHMRRRTDWDEVVENIELVKKYPNVVVDFNGLVSFLSVMRFYEMIDWCKENPVINQLNWAFVENPRHLRPSNLPKKIKDALIPKYKDWPDIVASLKMEANDECDIQDVFAYLLKTDEFYKGTKWESHLFDVFPELEEFYIPAEITTEQEELFKDWDSAAKKQEEAADKNII